MNNRMMLGLVAISTCLPLRVALGQGVLHVDASAAETSHGSSWQDAYIDMQNALAVAIPGDELRVAGETCVPGSPVDAVSSCELRGGIALCGGFTGTKSRRNHAHDGGVLFVWGNAT